MKTIFIHIGAHKTGSTAIQNALRLNKRLLKQQGFRYLDYAEHAQFLKTIRNDGSQQNLHKRNLRNKINISKCNNLILSDERYSGMPRKGYYEKNVVATLLKDLLQEYDVKIVAYLRRQDYFIESLYTQWIHSGLSLSFNEFYDSLNVDHLHYTDMLHSFESAFSKENIIVRPYEKNQLHANDVVQDFFNCVGIQASSKFRFPEFTNKGYNKGALEIARICNKIISDEDKIVLRKLLQSASTKETYASYKYFTQKQRNKLLKLYQDSNSRITKLYFPEESDRPLFKVSSDSESTVINTTTIDDRMIATLGLILVQQEKSIAFVY